MTNQFVILHVNTLGQTHASLRERYFAEAYRAMFGDISEVRILALDPEILRSYHEDKLAFIADIGT